MTMELVRDILRFDQVVGDGQSQTLVDKDIIVPDAKPDIDRILSIEGDVNITNTDVDQDRVEVEGVVSFSILYASAGQPQPAYSMIQEANFSHYINIPGALPKMEPEVKCSIEHIDYNRLNGRKLNLRSVLNMYARVTDNVPIDAVKDITGVPDIQFLRDSVAIDEVTAEEKAQTVVRGTIEIPHDMPSAAEILKCSAIVHKKDVSVEEGKVIITGSVLVPVLFISRGEQADIYRIEDDMVFSHTLDVPGLAPHMTCGVDYSIEDVYTELQSGDEDETRSIDVEVVVGLKVKAFQKNEIPVIVDAYGPSTRLESERKDIMLNVHFGEGMAQTVVKESLSIPGETPDMEKVYDVVCKPSVTEIKAADDKVLIEGIVGFDVIYLGRGEDRKAYSFAEELPFKASAPIPGCKEYMAPEVSVDIESMGFTMLAKDEVEVKAALTCTAKVYDKVSKQFIVKMGEVEGELPLHKASITIYVVQPKDTLWKIAKRYMTTVDHIVKVNDIADPDNIAPGMKLIIPKSL